jgi:hypothetical protein
LKSCAPVIFTAPEPKVGIGIFVGDDRDQAAVFLGPTGISHSLPTIAA